MGQYTDKMTQKCVKNESFSPCSDTLLLKWVKWFTWGFNNSHQRETVNHKSILFAKLVRQWKSKEWAKFELKCLLIMIFIYSNSKFKVTCKTRTLNAGISGLKPKRYSISNITFAILPFYQKNTQTEWSSHRYKHVYLIGHPKYFRIYYSWWNH